MHSWVFRHRARLAVLYGTQGEARPPAPADRPALADADGGLELLPRPRRTSPPPPR